VTGSNSPHDGPEPADRSGRADETVQWWSTPANTSSGAPATGTDPTVLGTPVTGSEPTVPGGGQYDAYQSGSQPYAHPTPPQPVAQPGYPADPYQAQPYAAQPYAAQPYGAQPYNAQAYNGVPYARPGFPAQPFRPPRTSNATPWIIGGVVVVIVGILIGVVALAGSKSGGSKSADGNYSMTNVTNGCNLVDLSVLKKWGATTQKSDPTHTERKPDSFGGGSVECRAEYQSTDKYNSNSSDLSLDVWFTSKYDSDGMYKIWKDGDSKTTGSGRTFGNLSGIGQDAYYSVFQTSSGPYGSVDYTCAVKDSNVAVKIDIDARGGSSISPDDVGSTCRDQLKKVLSGLHK
jgi:hypothetical protein